MSKFEHPLLLLINLCFRSIAAKNKYSEEQL